MKEDERILLNKSFEYFDYVKNRSKEFIKDRKYYSVREDLKKELEKLNIIEKFYEEYVYVDGNIKLIEKTISEVEEIAYSMDALLCQVDLHYESMTQSEKYIIYLLDYVQDLTNDKIFDSVKPELQEKFKELEEYWKEVQEEKLKNPIKNLHEDVDPYGEEEWIEEDDIIDVKKLENISHELNRIISKVMK